MRKWAAAVLIAASFAGVGTSLTADASHVNATGCKTVKVKETRLVWNAKHTKRVRVDVTKLVKKSIKQDGHRDVFYVKVQVYRTERVCTAATSVTAPTTTVAPVPTTSAPVTAVVTTSVPSPPITTTTVPATTTTTTEPPTTTTLPAGPISTETTLAPVNTSYPNTCGPDSAYCYGETVFSVVIGVPGLDVSPAAGEVQFVFDAPVTDTDGGSDPWQFNQFTLTTTEDGQTACPLQWQYAEALAPGWWQAAPSSVATGGLPACTMTDVALADTTTSIVEDPCSYAQPFYGPPNNNALHPGPVAGPCGYAAASAGDQTSLEPDGDTLIGTPLTWEVTAEFIGDGSYAASYSAAQNFTVGGS